MSHPALCVCVNLRSVCSIVLQRGAGRVHPEHTHSPVAEHANYGRHSEHQYPQRGRDSSHHQLGHTYPGNKHTGVNLSVFTSQTLKKM